MYHSNSAFRIDGSLDMHPLCKIHPELAPWKLIPVIDMKSVRAMLLLCTFHIFLVFPRVLNENELKKLGHNKMAKLFVAH
jgi:hypothetical protein